MLARSVLSRGRNGLASCHGWRSYAAADGEQSPEGTDPQAATQPELSSADQGSSKPVDVERRLKETLQRLNRNLKMDHWDTKQCSLADTLQRQADFGFQMLLAKHRLAQKQ